ncbi:TrmH family RNA methyltransferase [Arcanobacterium urinimassiliense]|uniref:TrmH family RNA methyltransferase n=1 Tax=Arcanobacterium urinimassiliense TaxID=1871014 RepID=UPI001F1BA052|nr:RNA methyltransferase [Arcanobacterium urinimassiliense]
MLREAEEFSMRIINTEIADTRLADFTLLTDVALRKKLETERGLYLAEGLKVIARSLAAGHVPRAILSAPRWVEGIEELLEKSGYAAAAVPIFVVSEEQTQEITGYRIHRGALAAMNRPQLPEVDTFLEQLAAKKGRRIIFILEDLVDHTNVGAIFRSAAALGVDGILVSPSCADPLYRRSVKVSMGSVFQVPWARLSTWPRSIKQLQEAGWITASLALDKEAISLRDFAALPAVAAPAARIALILGTEGDGLSGRTIAAGDYKVMIPMCHGIDSLNVAAAGALAAWELVGSAGDK